MAKFEKVSKWADSDINMPVRKTTHSAGYDFEAVEDILIEPYQHLSNIIVNSSVYEPKTLSDISKLDSYDSLIKVSSNSIDVNIKMLIEDNFTPYQKDEIEQHIKTAVETYFANNIYIGRKLSINRLESYILQYLFDERYDIYEVEVSVESNNSDVLTDLETGQLKIQEYQRLYPNIIYTAIEYSSDL